MHLLVDISFHGYGHLSQTAPVLNALRERLPQLKLTLRSAAPYALLAARMDGPFQHIRRATDFGMAMHSALSVDAEKSTADYLIFHREWDRRVAREVAELKHLAPDLVLSNVSYLALAAARQTGIPAVALCSLNWADILAPFCAGSTATEEILAQMRDAYASAERFLRPQPTMPMPWLSNGQTIGPIARIGRKRRAELEAKLGARPGEKLVLISMGGFDAPVDMGHWPRLPGVRWLAQGAWCSTHPDAVDQDALDMPFIDLMASCDAIIAKPGYGMFAEAACNGTPLLYVRRDAWPEEVFLLDWLRRHGRCLEVARNDLRNGDLAEYLKGLLEEAAPPPVAATGVEEAAAVLAAYLI